MSRDKTPFSELCGISPGDCFSPGIYRKLILSKVISIIFYALVVAYIIFVSSIGVSAASVSDGDSVTAPETTEAPAVSPVPAVSPSPVPDYTIGNEVNLDGANLFSNSDTVTVYTQAVILASEEETETDTSTFPEKSGYFVVPISDTECAYVPEGYEYWIVFQRSNGYFSGVSDTPLYIHSGDDYLYSSVRANIWYSQDGSVYKTMYYTSTAEDGHLYNTSGTYTSICGGNYIICSEDEGSSETSTLESIVLSSESLDFSSAVSQALTASVQPEGFTGILTWTSTDESVARYSGGLVIPVADGTCQIIVSYANPDGTVVSASCDVTVSLPVVDEEEEPTELEEFLQEPIAVDRYQYEILKKLEFMQYAQAIMVTLIFILIFKRK